jgi:hypothetical protein
MRVLEASEKGDNAMSMMPSARGARMGEASMDQATAMEELRERYARGGLPLEEFRRLMGALMVTSDPAECRAILEQLPPETAYELGETIARQPFPARPTRSERGHHIVAFFGQVDRSGVLWELGPETEVQAIFGEVKADVRMAKLSEGENLLRVTALFGSAKVIVPEGLRIYVHASARFGEVKVPGHSVGGIALSDSFALGASTPGSYLRIEASATFGEVKIVTR